MSRTAILSIIEDEEAVVKRFLGYLNDREIIEKLVQAAQLQGETTTISSDDDWLPTGTQVDYDAVVKNAISRVLQDNGSQDPASRAIIADAFALLVGIARSAGSIIPLKDLPREALIGEIRAAASAPRPAQAA